jgi:hypothetical protein
VAELQIVRKGTTTNKLTIAKDRIELKVMDKVSAESEIWLFNFAQKVVDEVAKTPSEFTLRGRFDCDPSRQRVRLGLGVGQSGAKDVRYFYSDKMEMSAPPEDVE